jgi:hypothetical protein
MDSSRPKKVEAAASAASAASGRTRGACHCQIEQLTGVSGVHVCAWNQTKQTVEQRLSSVHARGEE